MTTEQNVKKSRGTMILLAVVFLLPVLLAKLALEFEWFNKGATNHGELLQPSLSMDPVHQNQTPIWRLLFVMPQDCDQACDNAIYSINQIWGALGKEQDRAVPTVMTFDGSAALEEGVAQVFETIPIQKSQLKTVFKDKNTDGIFIVDTLGNIILRYPLQPEKQQAILFSREILADLRKLLKLSRIG